MFIVAPQDYVPHYQIADLESLFFFLVVKVHFALTILMRRLAKYGNMHRPGQQ